MIPKLGFAAAGALLLSIVSTPGHAKECWYQGYNRFTQHTSLEIKGHGVGTQKGACRRAQRKCLNKLRRAWKHGKAQQYACTRVGNSGF